jgi:putative ABC transport system permease protein
MNLFRLIWNRKRQNFLIMLELFFSFIILFAMFTLVINYYQSYKQPAGFEYASVWSINRTGPENGALPISRDSAILLDRVVKQQVKSMPGIEEVSYSGTNTPYSGNRSTANLTNDKTTVNSDFFVTEDSYANVLGMQMEAGRWFTKEDDGTNYYPCVINQELQDQLFDGEEAVNKLISFNQKTYKVVGVAGNMKTVSDYTDARPAFYTRADTTFYGNSNPILVKVKDADDATLEPKLFKSLSGLTKSSSVEIVHLDEKRESANKLELFPVIMVVIIVIFFIINVALGLFGVLWQNINKRKSEIGLRMAIGASRKDILKQMVGETLLLTSLAVLVGSFFAIQFPLLNILDIASGIYFTALLLAIVFLYLFVTFCALYPARQAASIYPRDALHNE